MDGITEFVGKTAPIMTYASGSSVDSITAQIAKLNSEKTAVEGVLTKITNDLTVVLNAKAISLGGTLSTFGQFGIKNVGEWIITIGPNKYNMTYNFLDNTTVQDHVTCPTTASKFVISAAHDIPLGTVVTTSCSPIPVTILGKVGNTYTVDPENLNNTISTVGLVATGLWDSDAIITKFVSDFDFAYDHLNAPLSATATYGINANLASLASSSISVAANKVKTDNMDSIYRSYTQWTKVLDNTDPLLPDVGYYIDPETGDDTKMMFYCSNDMTSTFPVSADILIDCGVDKQKGGIVDTCTYVPVSAGDYTEVTIVINTDGYMATYPVSASFADINMAFDNPPSASLLSVQVFGGLFSTISGVVYNDLVSFLCPGDMTSTIPSGAIIVATYDDLPVEEGGTPIRYFTVYASEHKSSTDANRTIVTISNGLELTTNIEAVSIVGG